MLTTDLEYILKATTPLWEGLRNRSIFISGGTGFFGTWLLESIVWANRHLNLNTSAMVLTRNPAAFQQKCPHLFRESCLEFYEGDIKNFTFPDKKFSHIIHAATDASAALNKNNPIAMYKTILDGTQRILEFSVRADVSHFLFLSSGAVYGRQPLELSHISEDYPASFECHSSAYASGKQAAENLCHLYAKQHGIAIKIARCFAFVGPYLPLDIHFAIGNFIRDGLNGKSIHIGGDGTPLRSYLYAADLMIWLLTILFKGESLRPYNVGSDEAYTIAEIAGLVAHNFGPTVEVKIAKAADPTVLPERYIPDITRAHRELGLSPLIGLSEAIKRTKTWYQQKQVEVVND